MPIPDPDCLNKLQVERMRSVEGCSEQISEIIQSGAAMDLKSSIGKIVPSITNGDHDQINTPIPPVSSWCQPCLTVGGSARQVGCCYSQEPG